MRFDQLRLEKYGAYEDRVIDFRPGAHLHIIVGANEAGKTSALSAIGDLLFGFPRSAQFDFRFDARALRLGAAITLQNGQQLSFRRRRGNKNTLLDADDKALADDPLAGVIGSLDRTVFELEYGLTSERLRQGGDALLAADGRLAESLAAGSAELSALNRLKSELQKQADDLFTPRKVASKDFYVASEHYVQALRVLRDATVTAAAVEEAQRRSNDAAIQLKQLEDEHREVRRDLSRLQRAKRTRGKILQISETKQKLSELSALPAIEPRQFEQWREAHAEAAEIARTCADLAGQMEQNAAELTLLQIDQPILDAAEEIERMREFLGAAEKARQDLPNREKEQHATLQQLGAAARKLGLESAQVLIDATPKPPVLARIGELVRERRDLEIRLRGFEDTLKSAQQRLAELERLDEARSYQADPAPMARALESFDAIPGEAARLHQARAELNETLAELERRTKRLQPPAPALENLVRLALPDISEVEAARRDWDENVRQRKLVKERISEALSDVDAAENGLAAIERAGDVVTRDDLVRVRAERDAALTRLAAALDGARAAQEQALTDLRAAQVRLDAVTDGLLGGAERAAKKLALEQELEKGRNEEQRLRDGLAALDRQRTGLETSWQELWARLDIEPLAPDAMSRWLVSVADIVDRYDRASVVRTNIAAREARLSELEPALKALLPDLGVRAVAGLPLEEIYDLARKALTQLQEQWLERREHAVRLENARTAIQTIEADRDAVVRAIAGESQTWADAMATISCPGNAGCAEAGETLKLWTQAGMDRDRYEGENHRVVTIGEDLEKFQTRLRDLCTRVAPDLLGSGGRTAVEALVRRLQEQRRATDALVRLQKERSRIEQQNDTLARREGAIDALLAEARQALALGSGDDFGVALDRLQQRQDLSVALQAFHRELADIGEGVPLADLQAEQEALDPDTIDGEVEQLGARADQLLSEIKVAVGFEQDARRAFETLAAGRNASAAAQQKQEAAAELLDVARRWLVRMTAARLAGQAIERHRRTSQDPVIARASALFAHATDGAFEALGVRFADDDQPSFAAIRSGGEPVPVAGLSDGTRDQLFLALRLALLEQRRGEPLPFIGDDILTSFDEGRTAQAIGMLAEFGQYRQTVIFSHHRHVAEIAAARLGENLDLIEL